MTKKTRRRLVLEVGTLSVLVLGIIFTTFNDWRTIVYNKNQSLQLAAEYTSLLEEEQILESEVNKLQDDEYLARYAREKYYYSKDGELIIRIPESE